MTGLAVVWAVATAASFGAADFVGGWVSRRVPVIPVVLVSQLVAVALFAAALLVDRRPATTAALTWGAAAGVGAGLAFVVYYRGLAVGRMGLVATVTAVTSAVVPAAVGVVLAGERPTAGAVVGAAVALGAVVLLSAGGPHGDDAGAALGGGDGVPMPRRGTTMPGPPGLVEGILAGLGYGAFFVCIERTGEGSAVWPLLAAAMATVAVVGLIAASRRSDLRAAAMAPGPIVAAGALQAGGGLAVLLAVRQGLLSLVAVVAALSPVPTTVLARVVLAEHLERHQVLGVGLAVVGVALIAAS